MHTLKDPDLGLFPQFFSHIFGVRALYAVLNCLDEKKSKKNKPSNAGKPWSKEDEEMLKVWFKSGMTKKEISTKLERSIGSISSRLARLGLIEN